ncbi:MAG: GNAT family N-acetyltransferase [bacterium]
MENKVGQLEQLGKLVQPSLEYKASFIEAMREFQAEGKKLNIDIEDLENNFNEFLEKIVKDDDLPDDQIPQTVLWLVDRNEFIGRVSVRQQLNERLLKEGGNIGYEIRPSKRKFGYGSKILELGLPIAKGLGIHKVLLTCDDDNVGSVRIIEKNGGVLDRENPKIISPDSGKNVRRYWIEVK